MHTYICTYMQASRLRGHVLETEELQMKQADEATYTHMHATVRIYIHIYTHIYAYIHMHILQASRLRGNMLETEELQMKQADEAISQMKKRRKVCACMCLCIYVYVCTERPIFITQLYNHVCTVSDDLVYVHILTSIHTHTHIHPYIHQIGEARLKEVLEPRGEVNFVARSTKELTSTCPHTYVYVRICTHIA